MKRYLPFVIIAGALIIAIVGYMALSRSQQTNSAAPFANVAQPSPAIQSSLSVNPSSTPTSAGQPGNPLTPAVPLPTNIPAGVSVTIEEFGDYQCPPCGLLHPDLKTIAAEYGNKVIIVFRNFPLTMNHKNALAAAQAA